MKDLTLGEVILFATCYANALQTQRQEGHHMYGADPSERVGCLEQAWGEVEYLRELNHHVAEGYGETSDLYLAYKQLTGKS